MANVWFKETSNASRMPTWFKKNRGRGQIMEAISKIDIFGPVPVEASKKPKYKQRPKKK